MRLMKYVEQIITGWISFVLSNQQHQSNEGKDRYSNMTELIYNRT